MKLFLQLICITAVLGSTSQSAFGYNPSILDPDQLSGHIPQDVADAVIKAMGIYFVHRPYSGATSMFNRNGLDLRIEATMMKMGDGVNNALKANNLATNTASYSAALPMLKLNLRKALSPSSDLGLSSIFFMGQYAVGGDFKFELSNPEEGISTALRLGYSHAAAVDLYLYSVDVISPELVASRRLTFAEPYIGIGGRYIWGELEIPFNIPPAGQFLANKKGGGYTGYLFTGVNFEILGQKGLRLGMEGSFDFSGYSTIGTTFGIAF